MKNLELIRLHADIDRVIEILKLYNRPKTVNYAVKQLTVLKQRIANQIENVGKEFPLELVVINPARKRGRKIVQSHNGNGFPKLVSTHETVENDVA